VDNSTLCSANPLGVPLSQDGFVAIAKQNKSTQMALFAERVVHHIGASVSDYAALRTLADRYVRNGKLRALSKNGFALLVGELATPPAWVIYSSKAKCVSDRTVKPSAVGAAIGWVCSTKEHICNDIPPVCSTTYTIGDYVFSRFYEELGAAADPLASCAFGGAGMFVGPQTYERFTGSKMCIVGLPA